MEARAATTDSITGSGNYLEFGKYLVGGEAPTGISPTVIPQPESADVVISVTREAGDTNTVTYTKQGSGEGPYRFTFGPNTGSGAGTFTIQQGTTYSMTNRTYSGGRGLNYRQSGQSIQFDDVGDNDFNDLVVNFSNNITILDNGGSWKVNE